MFLSGSAGRVYQLQDRFRVACDTFTTLTPRILVALRNYDQIWKFNLEFRISDINISYFPFNVTPFSECNLTAGRLPAGLV